VGTSTSSGVDDVCTGSPGALPSWWTPYATKANGVFIADVTDAGMSDVGGPLEPSGALTGNVSTEATGSNLCSTWRTGGAGQLGDGTLAETTLSLTTAINPLSESQAELFEEIAQADLCPQLTPPTNQDQPARFNANVTVPVQPALPSATGSPA
jgi:hypothetical protein